MVGRSWWVKRRVVPVGFDANDLLGKVLPNRAGDPLKNGQLGRLDLISPRHKHAIRRKFNSNDIAIHPGLTA